MPTKVRILATADIHIGRRPSRLSGVETAAKYSCGQMWLAIVQRAIELEVDLVVLAGDVVDHENRFFEATGPLEDGLLQLAEAGIPTYAVGGNHDFDVLPKIVDAVGSQWLHLMGRGGRWEEKIVARDGEPILRVQGWSFPSATVASSPIDDYRLTGDATLPTLGLLHADLDVRHSDYAPVLREELLRCPVTTWVLGHVHRPRWEPPQNGPGLLYTGSPQAMDPGETGVHGPWLIELHGPRRAGARQLAMSRVRYETLEIDLTGLSDGDELESHLSSSVSRYLAGLDPETHASIEQMSLRLVLCGRTPLCSQLEILTRPMVEQFERRYRGMTARIDKVSNETLPVIDLEALCERQDPTGALARVLLRLQSGQVSAETTDLVRKAQVQMLEVHQAAAYNPLRGDAAPDGAHVRQALIRQGRLLLDTLLAQRGPTRRIAQTQAGIEN
ncbi:MAG: metallophosphoesterase family protein [Thermoguttaceae bacterium]